MIDQDTPDNNIVDIDQARARQQSHSTDAATVESQVRTDRASAPEGR